VGEIERDREEVYVCVFNRCLCARAHVCMCVRKYTRVRIWVCVSCVSVCLCVFV